MTKKPDSVAVIGFGVLLFCHRLPSFEAARPALQLQTNKFFSCSSFLEPLSGEAVTGMFLGSPTKGDMQLLTGSNWTFVEDLPTFDWASPISEITSSVTKMDDLKAFCADQVEAGLAFYTSSTNGNPLVYDTSQAEELINGTAYRYIEAGNYGGVLHLDKDVDTKPTPTSGFYMGWTVGGEYLRYAVDITIYGLLKNAIRSVVQQIVLVVLSLVLGSTIHRLFWDRFPIATLPRETELREADFYTGLDDHEKRTKYRERKVEQRKANAALRRQLLTRQRGHRIATRQIEAKQSKTAAKYISYFNCFLHEKERTKMELAHRRADVYEARERRVRDRALAVVARRTEMKMVF